MKFRQLMSMNTSFGTHAVGVLMCWIGPLHTQNVACWHYAGGPIDTAVLHINDVAGSWSADVLDVSSKNNRLSIWETNVGTGYQYRTDMPAPTNSQTGHPNNLGVVNTEDNPRMWENTFRNWFPAAWTIEVSFKTVTNNFKTITGRDRQDGFTDASNQYLVALFDKKQPECPEKLLSNALKSLHPLVTPLIASAPSFSIWPQSDRLTDGPTTHWTGQNHRLTMMIRISNKTHRMMSDELPNVPAMGQASLLGWPTRTAYTLEADGIKVTHTFMTLRFPEDLSLFAWPLTYLTWSAVSTGDQKYDVTIYFDTDVEIAVHKRDQEVVDELTVLRTDSEKQPILEKRGDNLRIDWIYFYVTSNKINATASLALLSVTRETFIAGTALLQDVANIATPVKNNTLVLAFALNLGKVGHEPIKRTVMLAYGDIYSVRYFYGDLRQYWRKNGTNAFDLLAIDSSKFTGLRHQCEAIDAEVIADLIRARGNSYAQLGAISYRQTLSAQKLLAVANGQPVRMSKENFSNGCIATVDMLYPTSPHMLIFSPTMLKASLQSIMDYLVSPLWSWDSAPQDMGSSYPLAVGQSYGSGGSPMPAEESGNMLIMMVALSQVEDNTDFAQKYWRTLTEWYGYLTREELDPAEQLCTDDSAGHLTRNANLSIEAIMEFASYGRLCELTSRNEQAGRAFTVAHRYTLKWMRLANDGGHYVIAFGAEDTYSQKYNFCLG